MRLFTDSGVFHAEDVFSSALLMLVTLTETGKENIEILRGKKYLKLMEHGDVSFGFKGATYYYGNTIQARESDGTIYGTLGLIWKKYGSTFLKRPEIFDDIFVRYIDHAEVTHTPNILVDVIQSFNPSYDKLNLADDCFKEAVNVAVCIIMKELEKLKSIENLEDEILSSEIQDDILILERYLPYKSYLDILDTKISFVIYPLNAVHCDDKQYICKVVNREDDEVILFDGNKDITLAHSLSEGISLCKNAKGI